MREQASPEHVSLPRRAGVRLGAAALAVLMLAGLRGGDVKAEVPPLPGATISASPAPSTTEAAPTIIPVPSAMSPSHTPTPENTPVESP